MLHPPAFSKYLHSFMIRLKNTVLPYMYNMRFLSDDAVRKKKYARTIQYNKKVVVPISGI